MVEQRYEIESSFEFIERVIGEGLSATRRRTFCYPYGSPVSHNIDTIKILTELGCLFTVDVNYQDCDSEVIAKHAQELPRWDCNKFSLALAVIYIHTREISCLTTMVDLLL